MTLYTSIAVPQEVTSNGVTFTELEAFLKENDYVAPDDTVQSIGMDFRVGEKVVIDEIEVQ